jgi:membrane-associated protease RseP (regulator of RpoE activity)
VAVALLVLATHLGLAFALALGALVVWHEIGHVQAARRLGLRVTRPMLVPFTRRALSPESFGRTRAEQIEIALGGPLYGLHLCVPLLLLALVLGDAGTLRGVLAVWAGLNLLNLLPVHPFDGGRIAHGLAAAVHPFAGLALSGAGAAALAALALASLDPLSLIIGGLAAFEFLNDYGQFSRWRRLAGEPARGAPREPEDAAVLRLFAGPRLPRSQAAVFLAVWIGLVLFYASLLLVALFSGALGAPLAWWYA